MPVTRSCGVCKRPCTDTKFLPCLHAFCKICLKFHISQVPTNRQWEGFSCPKCNTYIKAIDPDKPLSEWADQFRDTLTKKKVTRPSETFDDVFVDVIDPGSPVAKDGQAANLTPRGSVDSLNSGERKSSSTGTPRGSIGGGSLGLGQRTSGASSPNSSVSDVPLSKERQTSSTGTVSSQSSFDRDSPLPTGMQTSSVNLETESTSQELFDDPFPAAGALSPESQAVAMAKELNGIHISESPSASTNSVQEPQNTFDSSEIEIPSNPSEAEQNMCFIHSWKPIIVTCMKCDSKACGQCLIENHAECKGTDFVPVSDTTRWPDMSELEDEVNRVGPGNDISSSSTYQLNQTRELVRQKIKQVALNLIKSIKQQETLMLKKVKQLYHDEIWRLSSGINPSESLLKEVQVLKDKTEDLSKEPVSIVLEADEIMTKQTTLLGRLKAVDFACVPPDICFVPDYDSTVVTLGDLVVDQGFYPKHDVPDVQEEEPISPVLSGPSTLTGAVPNPMPQTSVTPRVQPKAGKRNKGKAPQPPTEGQGQSQGQPTSQKDKKGKSLMGRLLSPKQKSKAKFYVKDIPEL